MRLDEPAAQAASDRRRLRLPRLKHKLPALSSRAIHTWGSFAISLVSLLIAVNAYIQATREPQVVVIMPEIVRVAQGEDYGFAYLYLQPAFVNTAKNDRAEVIRIMALLVERVGDSSTTESASFSWAEQATFEYDPATGELNYRWLADAAPLVVSPDRAQTPICVFNGPPGWYFEAGTYRLTLIADLVVGTEEVSGTVEIAPSESEIQTLNGSRGHRFITLRAREG